MNVRRGLSVTCAVLCVAAGLAACGGSDSSSGGASSSSPYVVTIDDDLSGPISSILGEWSKGAVAWFKYVNENGGVNGHQIKYYALDNKSQPGLAVADLKKSATQYNAIMQMGPDYAANLSAVQSLLEQYKLPLVVASGSVDTQAAGATGGAEYIYNPGLITAQQGVAQVNAIKQVAGSAQKIATMTLDNPSGASWLDTAKSSASAAGYQIVTSESSPETATTASSQVDHILAAHPDIIVSFITPPLFQSFMKSLRSQDKNIPVINSYLTPSDVEAMKDPNLYGVTGLAFAGVPTLGGDSQGMKDYEAAMKASGVDPALAQQGAFLAQVITATLKACGDDCTREKAASTISTLNFDEPSLALTPVQFKTGEPRLGLASADVMGYRDGTTKKIGDSVSAALP